MSPLRIMTKSGVGERYVVKPPIECSTTNSKGHGDASIDDGRLSTLFLFLPSSQLRHGHDDGGEMDEINSTEPVFENRVES